MREADSLMHTGMLKICRYVGSTITVILCIESIVQFVAINGHFSGHRRYRHYTSILSMFRVRCSESVISAHENRAEVRLKINGTLAVLNSLPSIWLIEQDSIIYNAIFSDRHFFTIIKPCRRAVVASPKRLMVTSLKYWFKRLSSFDYRRRRRTCRPCEEKLCLRSAPVEPPRHDGPGSPYTMARSPASSIHQSSNRVAYFTRQKW